MLRAILCDHDRIAPIADPARISDAIANRRHTVWVDIAAPTDTEWRCLRDEFKFHPLALEDVERRHQRPKIDVYPDYYFLVVYAIAYRGGEGRGETAGGDRDRDRGRDTGGSGVDAGSPDAGAPDRPALETRELAIFLGPNYIVTVHVEPIDEVSEIWENWQRRTGVIGSDVGAVLYVLLDRIVDDYFPLIDHLADRVEDLEERVFDGFDPGALAEIFGLKKDLLALRRIVAPERDVLNVLLRRDPPILAEHAVLFFQDVYDHTLRVLDSIDTYRDLLSSALDAYLSVQSNNLNEVMRRLTVISTIFLPLTFITGFFGMNFLGLPFGSPAWFGACIAVMVLTPVVMLAYFRWRGWS